jgi:hypothetical protein
MSEIDLWVWAVWVVGALALVAILLKRGIRVRIGRWLDLVIAGRDGAPADPRPDSQEERRAT